MNTCGCYKKTILYKQTITGCGREWFDIKSELLKYLYQIYLPYTVSHNIIVICTGNVLVTFVLK